MAAVEEILTELLATTKEQLRWQRASVLPQVRQTIDQTLTTTQMRKAYELCDGTRTGSQIGQAVGTSQPTISNWTRRWRDLGIAYETEGRVHHLTSLDALGLSTEVERG